jgi:hypothetical protein
MMKKVLMIFLLVVLGSAVHVSAQSEEAQQLLLNVEKLAQLKQILTDLKKGYTIVSTGYNTIKNISQGNFNLHKTFLDALLAVSPEVKNYRKVGDIINFQISIVKEYKSAFSKFKSDDNFSIGEIGYLSEVYTNLFNESIKSLDALANIVTANKLRMSDDERLTAIGDIFYDMQDKLVFLRHFNNSTTVLAIQRAKDRNDTKSLKTIYGINN